MCQGLSGSCCCCSCCSCSCSCCCCRCCCCSCCCCCCPWIENMWMRHAAHHWLQDGGPNGTQRNPHGTQSSPNGIQSDPNGAKNVPNEFCIIVAHVTMRLQALRGSLLLILKYVGSNFAKQKVFALDHFSSEVFCAQWVQIRRGLF